MMFFGRELSLKITFSKPQPPTALPEAVAAGARNQPAYFPTVSYRLANLDRQRMGFIKYLIEEGTIHD